ncbi:MAG: 50S ribosomal protein L29 [Candidatus Saccharimonadales bacterium]
MKLADIRKQSTADLAKEATRLRQEIAETRRRLHLGEIDNVHVAKAKRKDLARVLTVLGEQLFKETN